MLQLLLAREELLESLEHGRGEALGLRVRVGRHARAARRDIGIKGVKGVEGRAGIGAGGSDGAGASAANRARGAGSDVELCSKVLFDGHTATGSRSLDVGVHRRAGEGVESAG